MSKENETCRILSIDAWGSPCGECENCDVDETTCEDTRWDWNNWFAVDTIALDDLPGTLTKANKAQLITHLKEIGILSDKANPETVDVYDDQYNIVVSDKSNDRPLYAIEYGNLTR